jgi:hypothetical protein
LNMFLCLKLKSCLGRTGTCSQGAEHP